MAAQVWSVNSSGLENCEVPGFLVEQSTMSVGDWRRVPGAGSELHEHSAARKIIGDQTFAAGTLKINVADHGIVLVVDVRNAGDRVDVIHTPSAVAQVDPRQVDSGRTNHGSPKPFQQQHDR